MHKGQLLLLVLTPLLTWHVLEQTVKRWSIQIQGRLRRPPHLKFSLHLHGLLFPKLWSPKFLRFWYTDNSICSIIITALALRLFLFYYAISQMGKDKEGSKKAGLDTSAATMPRIYAPRHDRERQLFKIIRKWVTICFFDHHQGLKLLIL